MKKSISAILCSILLCLPFGVLSYAQQERAPLYVALGDSIATGAGMKNKDGRKDDAYAWIVAQEKGYDLRMLAKGGDISAGLLDKVTHHELIREAIQKADIITVSIGGNDFLNEADIFALILRGLWHDYSQMQPVLDLFRDNFGRAVAEIRALNPDAMLIVQTVYNPLSPLLLSVHKTFGVGAQGLNAVITDYLAENPGAYLVADVYTAFKCRVGMVRIDFKHPSRRGHAVIAGVVMDVIDAA